MFRAFMKWSKMLPLIQKCDELGKQLHERLLVVSSLRESYFRDVLCVKHHLEKLKEYSSKLPAVSSSITDGTSDEKKTGESADSLKSHMDMYDLHAIPSTNLRPLIQNALNSPNMTSYQLNETLVASGLINGATGKTSYPWEKGRNYKKLMRIQKGISWDFPKFKGDSVALQSPGNFKLFVTYCQQCIGTMSFVRDWNIDIEEALQKNIDSKTVDLQLSNLKNTVNSLNEIIEKQQTELESLRRKLLELKQTSQWVQQLRDMQDHKTIEDALHEKVIIWREKAHMASAELESKLPEVVERFQNKLKIMREGEQELRRQIYQHEVMKSYEAAGSLEYIRKIREHSSLMQQKEKQIRELEQVVYDKEEEIKYVRGEFKEFRDVCANIEAVLEKEKAEKAYLKEKSEVEIDGLQRELALLQGDYAEIEKKYDESRTKITALLEKNKEMEKENGLYKEREDEEKKRKREEAVLAQAQADWLASRPKHSLRLIALVVRCAVRISRAISALDFKRMGALGRRWEKRLQQLEFQKERNYFAGREKILAETSQKLRDTAAELQGFRNTQVLLEKLNETLRTKDFAAQEQIRNAETRIRDLTFDNKAANKENERVNKVLDAQARDLRRCRITAQMQRSHAYRLAQSLRHIRSILFSVGTDKLLHAGMVSFATAVSSTASSGTLDKEVVLMLRNRFIGKANEVVTFIKKINNKSRSLYPLHVEVTPGYAAGYGPLENSNEKTKKDLKESVVKKALADSYRKDIRLVDWTISNAMEAVQGVDRLVKDLRVSLQERNSEVEGYQAKQEELLATIERLQTELKTRPKSKKRRNRDNGTIEGGKSWRGERHSPGLNERKHMAGVERPVNTESSGKIERKVKVVSQKKAEVTKKNSAKQISPLLAYMSTVAPTPEPVVVPMVVPVVVNKVPEVATAIPEVATAIPEVPTAIPEVIPEVATNPTPEPVEVAVTVDSLTNIESNEAVSIPVTSEIPASGEDASIPPSSSEQVDLLQRQEVQAILSTIVHVIEQICSTPDEPVAEEEEEEEVVVYEEYDEDLYEQGIYEDEDESLDSRDIEIDELTANLRSAMSQVVSLQDSVDELQQAKTSLTSKSDDLAVRLRDMTREAMTLSEAKDRLTQDLTALVAEHKVAKNKIAILRDAVQDGYKLHATENAKKEEMRVKSEKEAEMLRLSKQVETCTQIACAVCAMRDEDISVGTPLYLAPTTATRPGSGPASSRPSTGTGMKRSTSPINIDPASKGTILRAKPRSINVDPSLCTDSVLSDSIVNIPLVPRSMVPMPVTHTTALSRSLSAANTSNKRVERDHGAMKLAKKLSVQYLSRPKTAQTLSRELYSNFKQVEAADDASLATNALVQQYIEMEDYVPDSRNKFSAIKNLPK